ncbi:HAMP domain-containing sensor histidine kinase [Fervidibacillus halotolerans]|uniref:histidine kinase n=1 Tax=Fervidibacillus halotolerans TaxID=2980027 RepID=A0A9E8S0S9_9BACI|nr:HAMP domain-containing sensor histidine kinase [Fervidibacillus halotolerans]WAA12857.1 HAMP domain-containing histidine kinase [Fervidibacillus halotolerans]
MLKNKEIQQFLLIIGTFSLISAIVVALFSPIFAVIVLLIASILILFFLSFTRWRYREIERLANYLRRIAAGDITFDIRDNQEGELSILKNEIYKVTQMLSEKSIDLQQEKTKLTDAISDISHQLKTPLTSMMMMTDLLKRPNLPDKKKEEFLHQMQTQINRLEWLVSSLLKLAKIDAGTVPFKKEKIPVQTVINKAIEPIEIQMEIKEQSLSINGEEDAYFYGDSKWTIEAITNIVKNCIEHTPKGGKISISFLENALFTQITIADNGIGIPKEDLPHIFKRFYKGKNTSDESVGIGLALARSIIDNQNGDIEVESEVGKGTTFKIKFYKQIV